MSALGDGKLGLKTFSIGMVINTAWLVLALSFMAGDQIAIGLGITVLGSIATLLYWRFNAKQTL